MISHPLNQCFIVREKFNEMWKNGVITFDKSYGFAFVNMVSCRQTSGSPKKKITTSYWVIKRVQASQELIPYPTLDGQPTWVHPGLLKDEDWDIVKTKPTSQQCKQAKKRLHRLKQQEKGRKKQEILEKEETTSIASLGATKNSLPKSPKPVRKVPIGVFMPP